MVTYLNYTPIQLQNLDHEFKYCYINIGAAVVTERAGKHRFYYKDLTHRPGPSLRIKKN